MLKGNFFKSNESKLYKAKAQCINGELFIYELSSGQLLQSSIIKDTKISSRVGNTTRSITFANNNRFETSDNNEIDKLVKAYLANSNQFIHWLETNYSIIAVMLIATVLITWAMIQYGLPAGAKWAASRVPPSWFVESGQTTLKYLDKSVLSPSEISEERQQQLRDYFLSSVGVEEQAIPLQVGFRSSELMGANAFALPSGDIIFTDQLVNLACDDRELLAIFAHEVGHIEQRHITRRVLQSSIIAIAAAITFGDSSSMGELIVAIPTFLLEMSYSREFEREADDHALAFLTARNIDLGFFTSIMNRVQAQYSDKADENKYENYFVTHPRTSERTKKFGQGITGLCD
jgi:Zn-dependent protease with chaperone function